MSLVDNIMRIESLDPNNLRDPVEMPAADIRGTERPPGDSTTAVLSGTGTTVPATTVTETDDDSSDRDARITEIEAELQRNVGGAFAGAPYDVERHNELQQELDRLNRVSEIEAEIERNAASGEPALEQIDRLEKELEVLNRALDTRPVVGHGSAGADIIDLQFKLDALGFELGEADGIIGPKTEAAVRAFQESQGITIDGVIGPETRQRLDALQNPWEAIDAGSLSPLNRSATSLAPEDIINIPPTETLPGELSPELADAINDGIEQDDEPEVVRAEMVSIEGAVGGGPLGQFEVGGDANYLVQHLENGEVLVTRTYSGFGAIEAGGRAGVAIYGGDYFEFDALSIFEAGAAFTGGQGETFRLESADQLNEFFIADLSREGLRVVSSPGPNLFPGAAGADLFRGVTDSVLNQVPGIPGRPEVESTSTFVELSAYGEVALAPAWLADTAQAGAGAEVIRGGRINTNNVTGETTMTTYLDLSAALNGRLGGGQVLEQLGLDQSLFDEDLETQTSLAFTTSADGKIESVTLNIEDRRGDDLYVYESDVDVNADTPGAILEVIASNGNPRAISGLIENVSSNPRESHFALDSDPYGLEVGVVVGDGGLVANVTSAERVG